MSLLKKIATTTIIPVAELVYLMTIVIAKFLVGLMVIGYFIQSITSPKITPSAMHYKGEVPRIHPDDMVEYNSMRKYDAAFIIKSERGHCTAFSIGPKHALTAEHCVEGNDSVEFYPGDKTREAKVAAYNATTDMALLEGDFSDYKLLPIETGYFNLPQMEVHSIGYPFGGKLLIVPLIYSEMADFKLAMKGNVYKGMSGGPLVAQDVVIGINSAVGGVWTYASPTYLLEPSLGIAFTWMQ